MRISVAEVEITPIYSYSVTRFRKRILYTVSATDGIRCTLEYYLLVVVIYTPLRRYTEYKLKVFSKRSGVVKVSVTFATAFSKVYTVLSGVIFKSV